VSELLHHIALAVAVLAIGQAGLRIAATAAPRGLERLIATAVLAVALAIAEALGLGLLNLGGDSWALTIAALATWGVAAVLLPQPKPSLFGELGEWWSGLGRNARIAAAALAGAAGAWLVWQLLDFSIGFDSSLYHYPLVAGWIANGSPGSALYLSYDIPYGNYPLTDEVALTWSAAIARSWVPVAAWNALLLVLLGTAAWATLRNLRVPRWAAGLATAALVTAPLLVRQLNEPQTDLPALAWLACVAALATAAGRRPALLVPAVVAVGLSVGTKPSTGPLALAALGVGVYLARDRLRPLAGQLAGAAGGAFVVGGIWYLRNLLERGSPLWPFAIGPFGDPAPRFLGLVDTTFLAKPIGTLDGKLGDYAERLGGTWLLLVGALVVVAFALLAPRRVGALRRPLLVAGGLAVVGCLIWSTAWGTGLSSSPQLSWPEGFALSSLRYLLPAIGAALLAVAVATRAGGWAARCAAALLAVVLGWNLIQDVRLGSPWTPPAWVLPLGAVAGVAALALGTGALARLGPPRRLPAPALALGVAVLVGVLVAPVSNGFLERYTKLAHTTAYGQKLVSWFLDQPGFEDGDGTIGIASRGVIAQLAGDRFNQKLVLVPQHASCREVDRLARKMPIVATVPLYFHGTLGVEGYTGQRCLARHRPVLDRDLFYVYRLPSPTLR
jgi:hypothetical protein